MTDLKFEDCLTRLEEIVKALEGGNLPLEDSLKVFEEGIRLAQENIDSGAASRKLAEFVEASQAIAGGPPKTGA